MSRVRFSLSGSIINSSSCGFYLDCPIPLDTCDIDGVTYDFLSYFPNWTDSVHITKSNTSFNDGYLLFPFGYRNDLS